MGRFAAGRYTISELYHHYSYKYQQWNSSALCDQEEHQWFPFGPCGWYYKTFPGRTSAAVLFSFSFVWPHLKLLLMHLFFYLPLPPTLRRNGNYWFAFFGKWSITDVLTMCT